MNNLGCIFLWGGEIALRMLGHRDPIVCYASIAPPNLGAEVLIMRFPIPSPPSLRTFKWIEREEIAEPRRAFTTLW